MVIRYLFFGLIFLFLWLLGFVLYPFIYPYFDGIYHRGRGFFWWFLNSDERTLQENKFGAMWWRRKKNIRLNRWWKRFFASYRWCQVRNPHYNFKLYVLIPRKGTPGGIKIHWDTTGKGGMVFCNEKVTGHQFARFNVNGQKQFRLSGTFKLLWWVQNYQFGMSEKRYIYKLRWWNTKEIDL